MNYASYDDLAGVIRTNLWKIPSDVDLIVGVPRSGMIAALMMAEYLNKHCTDLKAFIDGHALYEGVRGLNCREGKKGKVLILEDTVNLGCSMDAVGDGHRSCRAVRSHRDGLEGYSDQPGREETQAG